MTSDKLKPGDRFKAKQSDKTRSPYQEIVSVDDARTASVASVDACGGFGNRAQRRQQARKARNGKA